MTSRTSAALLATAAALAAAGCRSAPPAGPAADDPVVREGATHRPLGHAGGGPGPGTSAGDLRGDGVTVRDRWRVGFPEWDRGSESDSPYDRGAWWDPYHQHLLKGDYPLPGTQNTFLVAEALSLTRVEARKVPTPSGVFPSGGGGPDFFRNGRQELYEETLFLSVDLFQGETAFKPVDWRVFVQGALNRNHSRAAENLALFADPSKGTERDDRHGTIQQGFVEATLGSVSPHYDVVQVRAGTQRFNADFRGFLFLDEPLGVRLFGTLDDNRWQWNAAGFRRWDKDTNSGLNTFDDDKQRVLVLNLYRQDLLEPFAPRAGSASWNRGLTGQIAWVRYFDDDSVSYDENGFLVRPRPVGTVRPNHRTVDYLGWNMDGHVGRLNLVSSLYRATGRESFNEIAGRRTEIEAHMAALETSVDSDWMRWRAFGFWQSGDGDPLDRDAEGFDAVFDRPNFAGGEFGFWNRNAIRLTGTGVGLVHRGSLLNSLRSSKDEGQPSFVNPGLLQFGAGWDGQLTPHLKVVTNASYLLFDDTASLERVLNQDAIGTEIGYDLSAGVIWRPGLTENVVVKGGVSALVPGHGFRDIYTGETLYAVFVEVLLTW